jgi:hypothetical protein
VVENLELLPSLTQAGQSVVVNARADTAGSCFFKGAESDCEWFVRSSIAGACWAGCDWIGNPPLIASILLPSPSQGFE